MSHFPKRAHITDIGFVNSVLNAYNNHYNLVIRPDDIWGAIITQFSFYINKHAKEFEGKFFKRERKPDFEIILSGSLRSLRSKIFQDLVSSQLDNNLVDQKTKDWVLPGFSTTTETDSVSIGVAVMASLNKYFSNKSCLRCGIPYVTLEGTVQDWQNILVRLEKLSDYNLEDWYDLLEPVLREFVNAKDGAENRDFWQRIAHFQAGGSGPSYISGWVTVFCVFDKDGNWIGKRIAFWQIWLVQKTTSVSLDLKNNLYFVCRY